MERGVDLGRFRELLGEGMEHLTRRADGMGPVAGSVARVLDAPRELLEDVLRGHGADVGREEVFGEVFQRLMERLGSGERDVTRSGGLR